MKRVFRTIEFDKILNKLCAYTESEKVAERINKMDMLSFDEAKLAQRETSEAVMAMLRQGNPPVNLSVKDVSASIKRTQIGAVLNQIELLDI